MFLPFATTMFQKEFGGLLPVLHVSISLRQLRAEVYEVASKEEVVLWLDGESISHEDSGI